MTTKFLQFIVTTALLLGLVVTPTAWGQAVKDESRASTQSQGPIKARGKVTDNTGEVLPGVLVKLKNTGTIVVTDVDGQFVMPILDGIQKPVLVFSYLGMNTKEVAYNNEPLDVVLESNTKIAEVVVRGMFNKPRESYTGAATMITSSEMSSAGSRSVLSAIGNIDPSFKIGADIASGSDPNAMMAITMRGSSSLPAGIKDIQDGNKNLSSVNAPLYILNGFEVTQSRIMDLDESLIQDITLLKDASSTAVYGTRGSNGVVVVTTKLPEAGRLSIQYLGSMSLEMPQLSSYTLMNAREKLDFEKLAGLYTGNTPAAQLDLDELYNQRNIDVNRGVDTYWMRFPVRTGIGTKHSVQIDGGEKTFRYSGGISYNTIKGAMKGSERNIFQGNMLFEYVNNGLSLRNEILVGSTEAKNSPYGNFSQYTLLNSYWSPYDQYGNLVKVLDNTQYSDKWAVKAYNPLLDAELPIRDDSNSQYITNNFYAEYAFIPNELILKVSGSFSSEKSRTDKFLPSQHSTFNNYTGENLSRRGSYMYSPDYSSTYDISATASYTKTFAKVHQLFVGLNYNVAENQFEKYTFNAEGMTISNLDFIGMANKYAKDGRPGGYESTTRRVGASVNANYVYDKRYFVDVSGTMEASSQFGANNRYAPFWSTGIGWNIYNENFLKDNPYLQIARIRASYGTTGKQSFSPYQAITTYNAAGLPSYKIWNGMQILAMGNPNLGWEITRQVNIGAEVVMFDNRFTYSVDVYNKVSDNLLADLDLPESAGYDSYRANVGKIQNRGFEMRTNIMLLRNRAQRFSWSVGGAIAQNKNKILEVSESLKAVNEILGGKKERNPSFLYREGESMNTLYAVESRGIDPSNGKEVFIKLDGSKTYIWDAKDKVACGVAEPTLYGTFNTTMRYRGLSVTAYFRFTTGGYMYNKTLADRVENIHPSENADIRALYDRWQKPGDVAQFKQIRELSSQKTETYATSRFVMYDQSLTGQSMDVKYEFPTQWTQKNLNCQQLSLRLNLENIFYWGTVKQERGTSYPYSDKIALTVSARF